LHESVNDYSDESDDCSEFRILMPYYGLMIFVLDTSLTRCQL